MSGLLFVGCMVLLSMLSLRARQADPVLEPAGAAREPADLARVRQQIALLETTLERMARLEVSVRHMTELDRRPRGLAVGPLGESEMDALAQGRGTLASVTPGLRLKLQDLFNLDTPSALETRVDTLLHDARNHEVELAELDEFLHRQRDRLARTPSIWPVRGWLTSTYGWRRDTITGRPRFHEGIDIAGPMGTPIRASADGTVVFAGVRAGYGRVVIIDHGSGVTTVYGHLLRIRVSAGDTVRREQIVGLLGSSGRSTGPHLHYEVRVHDIPDNPMRHIFE